MGRRILTLTEREEAQRRKREKDRLYHKKPEIIEKDRNRKRTYRAYLRFQKQQEKLSVMEDKITVAKPLQQVQTVEKQQEKPPIMEDKIIVAKPLQQVQTLESNSKASIEFARRERANAMRRARRQRKRQQEAYELSLLKRNEEQQHLRTTSVTASTPQTLNSSHSHSTDSLSNKAQQDVPEKANCLTLSQYLFLQYK